MPEVFHQAASLGMVGLLFAMWWQERSERQRVVGVVRESTQLVDCVTAANRQLVGVIQANTQALTMLRDELRSYRDATGEWVERVSRQLEEIQGE